MNFIGFFIYLIRIFMNFSSDPINNLENLHAKNITKSISIYFIVLLALFSFLALLPLIKVDVRSQCC